MDFPHLSDTPYPHLNNENVYAYRNTFDYSRWSEKTVIRLVNVLWDSTYKDVVVFDSNEDRNAWFDSLEDSYAMQLETAARIVPEGYVKLPLPYDVAARYNYMCVEVPFATSTDNPIDYETNYGVRRWFFFIDGIEYGSPNSTHVFLTNDVWTNFHNDISIKYMLLERGHAPMASVDADTFLENPIENNAFILAPDVNFGTNRIIRDSGLIQFGNGTKYVVFATIASKKNIENLGYRQGNGKSKWSDPTYSDISGRDGHQLQVNNYVWGDGYDYSKLATHVDNFTENVNGVADNVSYWCISAKNCFDFSDADYSKSFLVRLAKECPSFIQTVVAMFVVDSSMIKIEDNPVNICGYRLKSCVGKTVSTKTLKLTKDMFGFPEKYENMAKLYTYPYSALELTDNDGKTIEVRVEDTGSIKYTLLTALAYPFIDMRVMFNGIGGSGSKSYTWKNLVDERGQIDIGNDDWGSIKFDWPIPTYSLYLDGGNAYNLRNSADFLNARIDALVGYHAAMRDANCAKNNSDALANTANSNAYANANTLVANTANSCNAQTANTALTAATNTANTTEGNAASTMITNTTNSMSQLRLFVNNTLMLSQTAAENEVSIATTANTGEGAVSSGVVNGMASSMGGASSLAGENNIAGLGVFIAGGFMGGLSGYIQAKTNNENAVILTQCKSALAAATASANSSNLNTTQAENTATTDRMNESKLTQTGNTNDCIISQTANNVNAATNNAANSANTIKANADRTQSTSVSNSGYTRSAAEATAKEILESAQDKAENRYHNAVNSQPQAFGIQSGSVAPDYFRTRGVQWKVRTQASSAIAQTGDYFARFGYAVNQMWNIEESGYCPNKHFCFWKATDVWVDDRLSSTNDVSKTIQAIFLNGVTVWKNPNEIGRVSVYDN